MHSAAMRDGIDYLFDSELHIIYTSPQVKELLEDGEELNLIDLSLVSIENVTITPFFTHREAKEDEKIVVNYNNESNLYTAKKLKPESRFKITTFENLQRIYDVFAKAVIIVTEEKPSKRPNRGFVRLRKEGMNFMAPISEDEMNELNGELAETNLEEPIEDSDSEEPIEDSDSEELELTENE